MSVSPAPAATSKFPLADSQQEISGRLRSEARTRNRYAIRGYLDTARKHGTGVMAAIRSPLAGNPWMPPIPA